MHHFQFKFYVIDYNTLVSPVLVLAPNCMKRVHVVVKCGGWKK